jgi:hypothetical protein
LFQVEDLITILDYDISQQRLKAFAGDLVLEDEVGSRVRHLLPVRRGPSGQADSKRIRANPDLENLKADSLGQKTRKGSLIKRLLQVLVPGKTVSLRWT